MTDRHRLAIQPDLLPQSSRDSRLRIGETDSLGADSTLSTQQPSQTVSQCDPVTTPGQVIPTAQFRITDSPRRSITAAASISPYSTSFNVDLQPRKLHASFKPNMHDTITFQIQDAAPRLAHSHNSSISMWD